MDEGSELEEIYAVCDECAALGQRVGAGEWMGGRGPVVVEVLYAGWHVKTGVHVAAWGGEACLSRGLLSACNTSCFLGVCSWAGD